MRHAQNKLANMVTVMLNTIAASVLAGHAHGLELAGWWTVIGGAVGVSVWGWLRGRRRDPHEAAPVEEPARLVSGAVGPDEYAAKMINCAELRPAPEPLPALRSPAPSADSPFESTRLISGHSSECPALFHYSESYAGFPPAASTSGPDINDLIANLNRVMPG